MATAPTPILPTSWLPEGVIGLLNPAPPTPQLNNLPVPTITGADWVVPGTGGIIYSYDANTNPLAYNGAPFIVTAHYNNATAPQGGYVNWPTVTPTLTTSQNDSVISNIWYNIQYQVTNPYPANVVWRFDDSPNSAISISWSAETEEQKVARELREIKYEAASKRAEELLLAVLPAKQRQQYLEKGYFDTEIGDKIYRINKGRSGNVKLIEKEKTIASFCIHPEEYLPHADNMLAQYLLLRTDERKFLAKANKTIIY